jgi:hypothetical protein
MFGRAILGAGVLVGCSSLPPEPEGPGDYTTLCDGCGSWSSSTTTRPDGALYRVRLERGVPADVAQGEVWHGAPEQALGYTVSGVGDVDGDGIDDVLASGSGWHLHRSGDAPPAVHATVEDDATVVGDLDGDGWPELFLNVRTTSRASLLYGERLQVGGRFDISDGASIGPDFAFGAPAPDVDGDGLAESAWINLAWPDDGYDIRLLPSAEVGGAIDLDRASAQRHTGADIINGGRSFDVGDIDGDGVDDLGLGEVDPSVDGGVPRFRIFSGSGLRDGEWTQRALVHDAGPSALPTPLQLVPLGDVDGDGSGDLAVTFGASGVRIVSGAALEGEHDLVDLGQPLVETSDSVQLDGRDVDGDGLSELLVASEGVTEVWSGADLAAPAAPPTWQVEGGTGAVLGGLDAEGMLVVWVADREG